MFNLLPQEQKKKIRQMYLRRFSIVYIVGGILLTVLFCALLVPSFVASAQKLKSAQDRKQIIENNISMADKDGLQGELAAIKGDIEALQKKDISPVSLVKQVILNKGPGIALHIFRFDTLGASERQLTLEGVAQNRDRLKQFLSKMEAENFKKVNLPISNFAKDKDIPFIMTIIISNE